MKILYTTAIALLISLSSYAQECVDFSRVINPGWSTAEGTVLYDLGGIVLKTGGEYDAFGGGTEPEQLSFFGYLHIDVTSFDCSNLILEFTGFNQSITVDGDTVDMTKPGLTFPVVKPGYEINYEPVIGLYTVSGDFDEVIIGNSTNQIDRICLTENCPGVGTNEVANFSFTVYPNPATNVLNIDADFESLEIVNLLGETVIQSNTQSKSIGVSGLATGTYFVKVINNGQSSVSRFIKK